MKTSVTDASDRGFYKVMAISGAIFAYCALSSSVRQKNLTFRAYLTVAIGSTLLQIVKRRFCFQKSIQERAKVPIAKIERRLRSGILDSEVNQLFDGLDIDESKALVCYLARNFPQYFQALNEERLGEQSVSSYVTYSFPLFIHQQCMSDSKSPYPYVDALALAMEGNESLYCTRFFRSDCYILKNAEALLRDYRVNTQDPLIGEKVEAILKDIYKLSEDSKNKLMIYLARFKPELYLLLINAHASKERSGFTIPLTSGFFWLAYRQLLNVESSYQSLNVGKEYLLAISTLLETYLEQIDIKWQEAKIALESLVLAEIEALERLTFIRTILKNSWLVQSTKSNLEEKELTMGSSKQEVGASTETFQIPSERFTFFEQLFTKMVINYLLPESSIESSEVREVFAAISLLSVSINGFIKRLTEAIDIVGESPNDRLQLLDAKKFSMMQNYEELCREPRCYISLSLSHALDLIE